MLKKLNTILLLLLVTPTAFADVAAPAGAPVGPTPMSQGLLFGGLILIFYLLIWRPQSRRAKEHKALVQKLAEGDEVVTSAGMLGKVTKITEQFIVVMIAKDVEITLQKQSIASALPKGTLEAIE